MNIHVEARIDQGSLNCLTQLRSINFNKTGKGMELHSDENFPLKANKSLIEHLLHK